jgi:pSer/pThr/pTyr-binding forkhead associated (FHA) protein
LNFEGRGKVIHCINVKANQERIILLGRNDTNDLILDEMSISRVHAKLIITKEGVDLYDCNSKFGTFVMLRGQLTHLKDVNLMSNKWAFELAISCE